MFISGGENDFPGEVEAVLADRPGVAEVAVLGVPDQRWGEVGPAFVVARAGQLLDAAPWRATPSASGTWRRARRRTPDPSAGERPRNGELRNLFGVWKSGDRLVPAPDFLISDG